MAVSGREKAPLSLHAFIYYFNRLPLRRADAGYTWLLGAEFKLPVEVLKIERDNSLVGSLHNCYATTYSLVETCSLLNLVML